MATKVCIVKFSSVQFSRSVISNSLWPHGLQHTRLSCHHQLLELAQTHVHRVSDAIQSSHPLLSPSPPAFNLSQHRSFPRSQFFISGGQSIGSFSFGISPSNERSGLISFRMDWFDLLAVQWTLKSLPQHLSSKATNI